ncbi:MAG: hypothetical protein HY823_01410 [Acidobacteria bacterium]|nr:hypothetical protein [Acidobacteriota bacterium]
MSLSLAFRALLALALPAALALPSGAQDLTHNNVPSKQMVWMSYQKPAGTVGWDVVTNGVQTVYPNLTYRVPEGLSLIVTDADLYLTPPNGQALSYYGSSFSILVCAPLSTDGTAIVVPFGYIPTYGVWNQVHLTAGTRVPSGNSLIPMFRYGSSASVEPNYQITLRGYYVRD